jgi:hypothetical protein
MIEKQNNETEESPEINPNTHGQFILKQDDHSFQLANESHFNKWC